jgi:hypothetical protein
MNNGDTVAKKYFTASFKSKKRRGFWIIYNENLALKESERIDVLGPSSSVNHARDFQPERWGFLQTLLKIEVGNHKKDEHGTQVSRYDFLKGIFE